MPSQIFTSSGTWTAPSGVTSVTVTVQAPGGVGEPGQDAGGGLWIGGGGGGGGGFWQGTIPVTPGVIYTIALAGNRSYCYFGDSQNGTAVSGEDGGTLDGNDQGRGGGGGYYYLGLYGIAGANGGSGGNGYGYDEGPTLPDAGFYPGGGGGGGGGSYPGSPSGDGIGGDGGTAPGGDPAHGGGGGGDAGGPGGDAATQPYGAAGGDGFGDSGGGAGGTGPFDGGLGDPGYIFLSWASTGGPFPFHLDAGGMSGGFQSGGM